MILADIEKKQKELEAAVSCGNEGAKAADPTSSARSFADKTLCTALDVGENMLKCGAEVHRVEDSISRICKAYGAEHVEVFSIPSLIIAAVRFPDGTYSSQVRRILSNARNLGRLELFNGISRKLCATRPDFDEAQDLIKQAKEKKLYPKYISYIGAALTSGAFAAFFGGGWRDAIVAAIVGVFLNFCDSHRLPYVNQLTHYTICSFLSGLVSMLFYHLGAVESADKVMIGVIMILVPGLSLDVALRDLLCGETVSGLMGFMQSLLSAAMLAVGFTVAIIICGGVV